jgi:hypothetical protein
MKLIRQKLERFEDKRKDPDDKRKKISWAVFSYCNEITDDEYRKSFKADVGTSENEFWNIAPKIIIQ